MTIWSTGLTPKTRFEKAFSPLHEIDEMFDRMRREFSFPLSYRSIEDGFFPRVEVQDRDENIIVSAELPGLDEKDMNVTLRDNSLIIEGEKKSAKKEKGKGLYSSEFNYGCFYRAVPLASEVDPDKVAATYRNGVLEVTLNKLEESKQHSKRIEIRH